MAMFRLIVRIMLVFIWMIAFGSVLAVPDRKSLYLVCKKSKTGNSLLKTSLSKSLLNCATLCANENDCYSANYFSATKSCQLSNDFVNGVCTSLITDSNSRYIEMFNPCMNGGTWNRSNKTCTCFDTFVGDYCHRRARDCEELPFQTSPIIKYRLKPLKNGNTMWIYCDNDKSTIFFLVLSIFSTANYGRPWTEFKEGYYATGFNGQYTGLEHIHQLTLHGRYDMTIFINTPGFRALMTYSNIRIGPESDKYRMSYDSFQTCTASTPGDNCHLAKDGFSGDGDNTKNMNGSRFGTVDNDEYGCAVANNFAWWYNTNCAYVSVDMTSAGKKIHWPRTSGGDAELQAMKALLKLKYFYDNE